ncbi:MAG: hypothetical protein IJ770_04210 [Alphaproteobacteria bacterium]|nr:hypothetical protein [Alphaproteobacteria bacterium]
MSIKKYKVVCSESQFSGKQYIDIAPENGVIHDQIFYSRIQIHRQTNTYPLTRLFGSIYLSDDNGVISVEFPKPQARKGSPEYEGILRQQNVLELKIIQRYKDMRSAGKETTLFVYSIDKMVETSESRNAEADAFERKRREKMQKIAEQTGSYKQKHTEQIRPQSLQEEQRMQNTERFNSEQQRRITVEQKRAAQTSPAWLRFQKQYSGD